MMHCQCIVHCQCLALFFLGFFGLVDAQDLFEKTKFLARHGLEPQTANLNVTNSPVQSQAASGDSWWKTFTPSEDHMLCLDAPGGNAFNGNKLWLWECNGLDSQKWVFDNYQIRFGLDERFCIDAGSMADGEQLILWECNGFDQQTWGYDFDALKVYLSGKSTCFDWFEGNYDNGQAMHVWGCNDQSNQQFNFWDAPAPGGGGGGGMPGNVFPSDNCQYDTGAWPQFNSQADLQNDQWWSKYFERIYGEVPSFGYPICPGAWQFLWVIAAQETGVVQNGPEDCPGQGSKGTGTELSAGTFYTGHSFIEAKDVYAFIANPNLKGMQVPANTFVEVTHTGFSGDTGVIWYYMSVGSGVWVDMKNTLVFGDHSDAATWVGSSCNDDSQNTFGPPATECEGNFPTVYSQAKSQGYNTIQFTNHYDCTCGESGQSSYKYHRHCNTEIVQLDDDTAGGCANPSKGLMKGGWAAQYDCNCDSTWDSSTKSSSKRAGYANCGSF